MHFAHIAKQFSMPYTCLNKIENDLAFFDMPKTGASLLEVIIDPVDNLKMKRNVVDFIKN